jgi:dolichyl-phosphate beta-glucosyltransferase
MKPSPDAGRKSVKESRGTPGEEAGAIFKPHFADLGLPTQDGGARLALSVVVPAYNEERRLGGSLEKIWHYLNSRFDEFELIIVDDGSDDRTAEIAASFARDHRDVRLISLHPNRGKGHAVRTGVLAARGALVLFSDADLATPIEDVERLLARVLVGSDVAIASRAIAGAELAVRQPWYRELAGRCFNLLAQRVTPGIRDTQCGLKLFRREAAGDIFSRATEDGFGFDAEALHIAMRRGYQIVEVPVRWVHQDGSKVRLLRDSVRMFLTLFRIGRRHRNLRLRQHEPSRV